MLVIVSRLAAHWQADNVLTSAT